VAGLVRVRAKRATFWRRQQAHLVRLADWPMTKAANAMGAVLLACTIAIPAGATAASFRRGVIAGPTSIWGTTVVGAAGDPVLRYANVALAAWSPDGKSFAATVFRKSATRFAIVPLGLRPRLTTIHGPRYEEFTAVVWSPDGTRIAVEGPSRTYLVSAVDGTVIGTQPLFGSPIGWAPSAGRFLVAQQTTTDCTTVVAVDPVSGAGTNVSGCMPGSPTASKDGTLIAWDASTDGFTGVTLTRTGSGAIVGQIPGASVEQWIEGGRLVLDLGFSDFAIWDPLGNPPTLAGIGKQVYGSTALSGDAQLWAQVTDERYRRRLHHWSVIVQDRASGTVVGQIALRTRWSGGLGLAFSPDGASLALIGNPGGDG